MLRDVYVVYEQLGDCNGDREEVQAFDTFERAEAFAINFTRRTSATAHVDWVQWEITRHGRETVDCDADIFVIDTERIAAMDATQS